MKRFVKLIYVVIVVLFLITMSVLGWYIMDERKNTETEIAELKKEIESVTLPKSEKIIETPEDVIIVKEYDYTTPVDSYMKIVAFDDESKVVWTYKSNSSPFAEYSYDMLWPHYENVYSMEENKLVILNVFDGNVKKEIELSKDDRFVAVGYYKGDVYALVDSWSDGGTNLTQKIYRIDKDGHVVANKQLESPIYDGFDQTIEKVEITRIDETEIEIFVTRLDEKNVEQIIERDF